MAFVKRILVLDLRSLALLRIGLGVMLLVDAIQLLGDVRAFFSDDGIYPRAALLDLDRNQWGWSLNLINGSTEFQTFLILCLAAAAISFAIGFRTKVSGVVCWVLLVSILIKNPLITQGGDVELCVILFWSLFLPIDREFSLESYKFNSNSSLQHFSLCGGCYILQIVCVYFFAALLKSPVEWREAGSAIHLAFNVDQLATPFAKWLLQFPDLLIALTKIAWYWEALAIVFLLIPFFSDYFKLFFVFGTLAFHFGIALTLAIGNFPFISMICVLGLLPSLFWKFILRSHFVEDTFISNHDVGWKKQLLCSVLLIYVVVWNIDRLPERAPIMPSSIKGLGVATKLEQRWNMFAPYPLLDDGWYVIPGQLEDGTSVDVYNMQMRSSVYDRPEDISRTFQNFRWRKYFANLYQTRYSKHRLYYARYLCRLWNQKMVTFSRLKSFKILYMLERSRAVGTPEEIKEQTLWVHQCF